MSESENQKSVTQWCDEHYPGHDAQSRLKHLIEEVTELAACMGVKKELLLDVMEKSWAKSQKDFGDKSQIPGECGDVQIAIAWLAAGLGVDTQKALDEKMEINRRKSLADSKARLARKDNIYKPPSNP